MRYLLIVLFVIGCNSTGTEPEIEVPEIGDRYGGGIVLGLNHDEGAWIISESNQSEGIHITCDHPAGGNQSADGYLNTRELAEACPNIETGATLVWKLSHNGYDDWYVPGKEMLQWVYESKDQTGINIDNAKYWSSACNIDDCYNEFYRLDFSNGSDGYSYRDSTFKIRAIRYDSLSN